MMYATEVYNSVRANQRTITQKTRDRGGGTEVGYEVFTALL